MQYRSSIWRNYHTGPRIIDHRKAIFDNISDNIGDIICNTEDVRTRQFERLSGDPACIPRHEIKCQRDLYGTVVVIFLPFSVSAVSRSIWLSSSRMIIITCTRVGCRFTIASFISS